MATTNVAVLPSGTEHMRKLPHTYHRPHVYKSQGKKWSKWWSACPCGHLKFKNTWHEAYLDALTHSESIR